MGGGNLLLEIGVHGFVSLKKVKGRAELDAVACVRLVFGVSAQGEPLERISDSWRSSPAVVCIYGNPPAPRGANHRFGAMRRGAMWQPFRVFAT
jgi:hypothetical protein